ncbi:MAG: hypothetical protein ACK5LS_05025 [Propioniciclava sp.]
MVGTQLLDARQHLRRVVAASAAVVLVGFAAVPVSAEPLFGLSGVASPAGMATDHAHNRYWVLAATGGRITLNAYEADGTADGAFNSRDYVYNMQGLAFVDGNAYVGDIGGVRPSVDIYRVRDPWPGTEINHARIHSLSYPDGSHTAMALLVDADRRISVVTGGDDPGIYQAPEKAPAGESSPLTRVADAPSGVTDGTVLLDGRIVLRDASRLYTLDPDTYEVVDEADIGDAENGQSLTEALGADGVITAATAAGEVTRHEVPGPEPATAEPTPEPSTSVAEPDEPDEPEPAIVQTGFRWAVLGGAAVAGLAALVVLLRRR